MTCECFKNKRTGGYKSQRMLTMTWDGYNERSGGYHGTWFHPMQGGSQSLGPQLRGGAAAVPVGYMDRMKAMSKNLRGLSRAELTRRQRSTIYENAVDIVDDLYDTSAFGGDTAAWGRVRDALPHRGVGPSGGADITGKNLWRSIKILFDTPAGRANALMLVVKCAKATSGLGRSHLPFLQQMAKTLGFPLVIMAGSTGMADTFSVTEDGGIVVRAAAATVTHAERGAAEALLQLGSR
jgi:hypothetical protein